MKRNVLTLVVVFLTAAAMYANPVDPSSQSGVAVTKNGNVFKLYYKSERSGNVKVTIYDATGNQVFSERINKIDAFVRPYNFSALPEGEYTIAVEDANGKQIEKVGYYRGAVKQFFHVTRVANASGKYILAIRNNDAAKFKIRVLSEKGEVLHAESATVSGEFAKVYNLAGVEGKVSFEVVDREGNIRSLSY